VIFDVPVQRSQRTRVGQPDRGNGVLCGTQLVRHAGRRHGSHDWRAYALGWRAVAGVEEVAVADTDVIIRDPTTGLFGFRLELGRDRSGVRMQARRTGFVTEKPRWPSTVGSAANVTRTWPKPRLSDTVQTVCQGWLRAREQELQPNTLYNYMWLLSLTYPHVDRVRASRLSARMIERAHRDLEAAGYSRSTLRTLDLVLAKAFGGQTGRTLGARKPRESDDLRPVWTLAEARRFGDHVRDDRLYPLWRLLLMTGLRRGELCGLQWCDLEPDLAPSKSAGNVLSKIPPPGFARSPPSHTTAPAPCSLIR
jgi:hypothetical protein